MPSYDNAGRMPRVHVEASAITLFVVAVLAAGARTSLRLYYQKRLFVDDGFLILAVLLASASMGLYFQFMDSMYMLQAVIHGQIPPGLSPQDIINAGLHFHKISDAFLVLSWSSIFAVKFSFLFFFKSLISRVRTMELLWRSVVILTTITWMAGCVGSIIPCPYFDERALNCAKADQLPKTVAIAAILVAFDIITDLAVISIPVLILRQVQIKLRTKFLLTLSLCLSFVMIIVTIIRASGLHAEGEDAIDTVWEIHWQWIECCVAVTMVSLTAFRSFFIQHSSRNQSPQKRPWYQGVKAALTVSKTTSKKEHEKIRDWPHIPGGTMTGMRTFIDGKGRERTATDLSSSDGTGDESEDFWPLQHQHQQQQEAGAQGIRVQHKFSTRWEPSAQTSDEQKKETL